MRQANTPYIKEGEGGALSSHNAVCSLYQLCQTASQAWKLCPHSQECPLPHCLPTLYIQSFVTCFAMVFWPCKCYLYHKASHPHLYQCACAAEFVDSNKEKLQELKPPRVAAQYYAGDLYMFGGCTVQGMAVQGGVWAV